ncbi:MAG: tetraacyldisaccharide 4'-kinase [Thermodesulfobacteriota bacterium]
MEQEDVSWYIHYPLYLLSLLYGLAIRVRFFLYSSGILHARKLPCKVISIGNITVGGSGKTPMAIFMAEYLANRGLRTAIVSRGYGGSLKGGEAIVSDGSNILLGPKEAGDEPYLMAKKLRDVIVAVGANRYKIGSDIINRFKTQCIILDDGFQHIRLKREMDILLIDSARGFGNSYLIPRGILREPLDGIGRADVLMIKNNNKKDLYLGAKVPTISFHYRPTRLEGLDGESKMDISVLKRKRVFAMAGIANPEAFIKTLKDTGAEVISTLFYPDHHWYSLHDLKDIKEKIKRMQGGVELVVTTEKDMARLRHLPDPGINIYAVGVELIIEDLAAFQDVLAPLVGET